MLQTARSPFLPWHLFAVLVVSCRILPKHDGFAPLLNTPGMDRITAILERGIIEGRARCYVSNNDIEILEEDQEYTYSIFCKAKFSPLIKLGHDLAVQHEWLRRRQQGWPPTRSIPKSRHVCGCTIHLLYPRT